jgi:hypothetical protein
MTLSKNRLKNILKKNKVQTKKNLKKDRKKNRKKKNSFRKKKINIRKKSIKQYRKRFAKKKRKIYIKGGGSNSLYNEKMYKLLNNFMIQNKSEDIPTINDENKSELKYYNFDFILIDEKDNQEILDASKIANEFDKKAKTEEEIADEKLKKKTIDERRDIDGSTKKHIEKGMETCKSHVYVVNSENPVAFTDNCKDGKEMDNWFKEIFNSI